MEIYAFLQIDNDFYVNMDDLTILSEEALTALSKEDLDKLDKEKELIPALIRFNDNKQRLIVIKRSKYFEGSNYDLYNDSSNLMGIYSTNLWKNVPEQDMKLLYGTWLQHGKLSRNYKYEDFRCIISFDYFDIEKYA